MRILHTSDWHLGRSLYGRKRYDEFSAFLDWLSHAIKKEGIDVLLVAGDVALRDRGLHDLGDIILFHVLQDRYAKLGIKQCVIVIEGN